MLGGVDTAKPYTTVNGVRAKGGSLDGAGPVIVGGMVLVTRAIHALVACQVTSCSHSVSTDAPSAMHRALRAGHGAGSD